MLARLLSSALVVVAVGAAPAPAATAASTKCVALVVDFSAFGGSVSSACVTAPTSATGSDILQRGHHNVTFDPRYGDNFVCAIDGQPASGCHGKDNTHYWVYYHRPPGSSQWQESQEGAGTYRPANASTEGWVYDNGGSTDPQPRNVPYRSICATAASPKPTPTTASTRTQTTAAHATASAAPTTGTTTTPPTGPTTKPRVRATSTTTADASATPTASPSAPAPTTSASTLATEPTGKSTTVPWGLLVAGVVALGLGTIAVIRFRRPPG